MNIILALKHHQQCVDQAALMVEIVRDLNLDDPYPVIATGVTAGGDERRLRGIPAIGRGVSGAIPGTKPGGKL